MLDKKQRPVVLAGTDRAGIDLAGASINPEHTEIVRERQARRLAHEHRLTWPVARLIAAHAFDQGGGR